LNRCRRQLVLLGVDRDRALAQLVGRAHDADRDLAAVGDEDLLEFGHDADGPGRAARHLQRQARGKARRLHQPAAGLPLAPGGGGDVDGEDQRVKPGPARAGQHVRPYPRIARRIHLEPALVALCALKVLWCSRGHGGQAVGNARLGAVSRQQAFRLRPDKTRHAHR
jgi:hypothetical protein